MLKAVVIGAGIVGVCSALALQSRGFAVTLVDRGGPGLGASFGNAGCFALSEVAPISMPGLAWRLPSMLCDSHGPLTIRAHYAPRMIPWLWRFWRAGQVDRVESIARSLAWLLGPADMDIARLLRETKLEHLVRRNGALYVYETDRGWSESQYGWDLRRRNGIELHAIGREEIQRLEPALSPAFRRGIFLPNWHHVVDPYKLVSELANRFRDRGGQIRRGNVAGFTFRDNVVTGAATHDGQILPVDWLVVAAGAWSRNLARKLGHDVPLDTERGYNTTIRNPGVTLTRPVCPAERSYFLTPMEMGLRIGGAVEFAGLEAPPNFRRSSNLVALCRKAVPGIDTGDGREWMGFRPSMPDSMPVIARASRHPNAILAFGHGHLGLTLAATTGRLVADLTTGNHEPAELSAFSATRF
jgi:D-amino-acid dehydrogenase